MPESLGKGQFAGYDEVPVAPDNITPTLCVLDDRREGQRAAVTGASSGIGKGYAETLAAMGWNLTLIARDVARLEELRDRLSGQHGVDVRVLPADLSRPDEVHRIGREFAADAGLDLVINNAGITLVKPFVAADPGQLDALLQLNSVAPLVLTRYALPPMLERGRGAIINVSSAGAFVSPPNSAAYCASKVIINSFTDALAQELIGTPVQVQALCPGMTDTELHIRADFDVSWVSSWMSVQQVVDASFAGLRMGEVVCVPGLRDAALISRMRAAGASVVEQTVRSVVADRYLAPATA
jgi:short-subunit dehydrogenase